MPKMKAVQVSKPGGNFELVERNIPEPGRNQVRIKVDACGICHSDALVKEGYWPGLQYPRVPGHEIAGRVDAVGADVTNWKPGQRVGVGWHGGHDFTCNACRRGNFMNCQNEKITGISYDGGYQEYMIAPAEAVAAVPDELAAAEAAPLLCAGITVFNALRNSGARAGDNKQWRRGLDAVFDGKSLFGIERSQVMRGHGQPEPSESRGPPGSTRQTQLQMWKMLMIVVRTDAIPI